MQFIASTSALLKHLQTAGGAIANNPPLSILEDFLLEVTNGVLTISATDMETSVSTSVEVDAEEDIKIAVPAKILLETLKALPDQPLSFIIDAENYSVEVRSMNGKYKLSGEDGDNYPSVPKASTGNGLFMESSALSKAISKTLFAVGTDDLRPAMTGVFFSLSPNGISFVATDAHKLVKYHRKDFVSSSEASFIVPRKALQLLKSALPSQNEMVEVSYSSTNVQFKFNNTVIICRLIDARFPDYNVVIPLNNSNRLSINRPDFLGSIKRISLFSNKTNYQVVLKLNADSIVISAQDIDFANEANERLECTYVGDEMDIGFNARFLSEVLTVIDGDEIRMDMSTASKAAVIIPDTTNENEEILMLVMPIILNY